MSKRGTDAMRECLCSSASQYQIRYRWAGLEKEDSETYIDILLSVKHPVLLATIFRRLFPNSTLEIAQNNAYGSACEGIPSN